MSTTAIEALRAALRRAREEYDTASAGAAHHIARGEQAVAEVTAAADRMREIEEALVTLGANPYPENEGDDGAGDDGDDGEPGTDDDNGEPDEEE